MDVHLVFNSFNKMLSISYEIVYPAQALFLEHISSTYPYLLRELATLDLAKLVTLMFDSVAKGQLISRIISCVQILQKTNDFFTNFCPSLSKWVRVSNKVPENLKT